MAPSGLAYFLVRRLQFVEIRKNADGTNRNSKEDLGISRGSVGNVGNPVIEVGRASSHRASFYLNN